MLTFLFDIVQCARVLFDACGYNLFVSNNLMLIIVNVSNWFYNRNVPYQINYTILLVFKETLFILKLYVLLNNDSWFFRLVSYEKITKL